MEKIIQKIRNGKAHEITEDDTNYLAACTKGASIKTMRLQPKNKEEATSILRGALKDSNIPFTVGGEKTILDGFPIIEPVHEINEIN